MSFHHDYPNRKDWHKPARGAKAIDPCCRNHGGCPICEGNRLHKHERRAPVDDPEGDDGTIWDDQYLSDHLLPGERQPMFFDDPGEIPSYGGRPLTRTFTHMGYTGTCQLDPETGLFSGTLRGIGDRVVFYGDNPEDARLAFEDAVEEYLAACAERGEEPESPAEVES